MIKRDLRKECLTALEKELEACGLLSTEEAQKLFRALAKDQLPKEMKELSPSKRLELGLSVGLAEGFRRAAKEVRSKAELDRALKEIEGLRYKLRPAITEAFAKITDTLPQKKRGPKPRLTDTEKQAACSTIDTLKANGSTTRFAIELTAKQYKATPRMMRRVWESHGRS